MCSGCCANDSKPSEPRTVSAAGAIPRRVRPASGSSGSGGPRIGYKKSEWPIATSSTRYRVTFPSRSIASIAASRSTRKCSSSLASTSTIRRPIRNGSREPRVISSPATSSFVTRRPIYPTVYSWAPRRRGSSPAPFPRNRSPSASRVSSRDSRSSHRSASPRSSSPEIKSGASLAPTSKRTTKTFFRSE